MEPQGRTAVQTAVDRLFDRQLRNAEAALESAFSSRDQDIIAASLERIRSSHAVLCQRVFTADDLHRPS